MLDQLFRFFFPKSKEPVRYKRLHIREVDWEQVEIYRKFPEKGLVFREINHRKHGPSIYVYRGGTLGGNHLGICKTYRPESFYEQIQIHGIRRDGNHLLIFFE